MTGALALSQHEAGLKHMLFAGKRAQLWATFNEPEVASLCGHVMGNHPPGNLLQCKAAGTKLCTMLRAHAAAYKAIKQMPGKPDLGAFEML